VCPSSVVASSGCLRGGRRPVTAEAKLARFATTPEVPRSYEEPLKESTDSSFILQRVE
jgi:hypothetical protein